MNAQTHADAIAGYARLAPFIPVVTVDDVSVAVPLARTLVEAGLKVVEVTLRTGEALAAIEAIAREVPEAVVAAGTVLRPEQIGEVARAGAKFIVTPGTSPRMAEALAASPIPAMPGCATITEALTLAEQGFLTLKFFPAGQSGGPAWLKSAIGPVPHVRFCPTGGVDQKNAGEYLACPNVLCVGGSWVTPKDALAARDFATIGRLAREAAALR
ncbi:MAG TPA: bifunctional 4-hydroxy-2-oxoglutarate aldolase/2-dehydro-3-deoxy-phosphogluconate aldolase [Enterovirga sp.]|jgi:2-dehydro-3-deoxyphosphogluconate aldolase/(4S)-4-hydroxy-2-oxoglutarate aldolase